MEKELTLKEKGGKKLREWKQQVEDLNIQLHLGLAETADEFEKQKENLSKWLHTVGEKLENLKDVSEERLLAIKSSLQELRVQAALGKAETEDRLKEQQKNIALTLHELKHNLSGKYDSSKEGISAIMEDVGDQLDDFHTRFDLLRLRFHLGKTEAEEQWNEKKKELSHKLAVLRAKVNQAEKETSDKWEGFSTEIGHAWTHFKKAFKN